MQDGDSLRSVRLLVGRRSGVDALRAGGRRCRSCSVPNTEEAAAACVCAAASSAWLCARVRVVHAVPSLQCSRVFAERDVIFVPKKKRCVPALHARAHAHECHVLELSISISKWQLGWTLHE